MKNLELIEMTIQNFKGIEHLKVTANRSNLEVRGDNATGKTTIFDAFTFALFGKDSKNNADFEIKTLDENGKVKQHGLEHGVEVTFHFDGRNISLKRVYAEKWTKKRGSSKQIFSGHTTHYFIDGVPKKKKEFDELVNAIIPEDVFKLLTNPLHFNENMGWKERREILMEIAGDVTDEEILQTNDSLSDIIRKLEGKDIEDLKAMIRMKQKKINEQLDKLPVRIDEIQLSIADVSDKDRSLLEGDREVLTERIGKAKETIENVRSGAEINHKRKRISEIELEMSRLVNEHQQNNLNHGFEIQSDIQNKKHTVQVMREKISNLQHWIREQDSKIHRIDEQVNGLRNQWLEVDAKEFQHDDHCICPTCEQELPADKVEESKLNFNRNKAVELERIVADGKALNAQMETLKDEKEKMTEEMARLEKAIFDENQVIKKLEASYNEQKEGMTSVQEHPEYLRLLNEKNALESEINQMTESESEAINEQQEIIRQLEAQKQELEEDISKMQFAERAEKRIEELKDEEKRLSIEYEQLESEMYQLEEYIRTKITLLEDKINSKFEHATFKLFTEQINQGIKETCETLYQGVPYNRGLNNASRVNIGLDILRTLQNHFGISAPVFIDNAESVTDILKIDAQMILLRVSEKHKTLTVKADDKESVAS